MRLYNIFKSTACTYKECGQIEVEIGERMVWHVNEKSTADINKAFKWAEEQNNNINLCKCQYEVKEVSL